MPGPGDIETARSTRELRDWLQAGVLLCRHIWPTPIWVLPRLKDPNASLGGPKCEDSSGSDCGESGTSGSERGERSAKTNPGDRGSGCRKPSLRLLGLRVWGSCSSGMSVGRRLRPSRFTTPCGARSTRGSLDALCITMLTCSTSTSLGWAVGACWQGRLAGGSSRVKQGVGGLGCPCATSFGIGLVGCRIQCSLSPTLHGQRRKGNGNGGSTSVS